MTSSKGVFHRSGVLNAQITIYFMGTVLDVPGTMVIELGVLATRAGWEGGSWVIKNGTDGLAGLRITVSEAGPHQ